MCEVLKHLHEVTIPKLYESVTLFTTELSLERLASLIESVPSVPLRYTRHFRIKVPFHERREKRCPHHENSEPSNLVIHHRNDSMNQDSLYEVGHPAMPLAAMAPTRLGFSIIMNIYRNRTRSLILGSNSIL